MAVTAYLGLGSNLGDRAGSIKAALEQLDLVPGIEVVRSSQLIETDPVGGPPQDRFLNGVAELATTLSPQALLSICRELERRAGRELDGPRNHPRPLDLDLLFFGDQQVDTRELVVPHPRWRDREFVTRPLKELGVDLGRFPEPESPRVITGAAEFSAQQLAWLRGDCVIGLVPTMGALHEGHASLFRRARRECDRVAATIFVNPKQFGEGEDLDKYPRDLERDLAVLRSEGVDAVFAPLPAEMYSEGFCSDVAVGEEARELEGAVRPGHFSGVATVVAKLFALSQPTRAYFGRKDAQQVAVLRRLVQDLAFPIDIRECDIVREPDGLAMSSRNAYLSTAERAVAPVLFRALSASVQAFGNGERDADALVAIATEMIEAQDGVDLEYLELRREGDLARLPAGPVTSGRLLVAARVGPTRLIDNMSLAEPVLPEL